ncbi:hypothetical protein ACLB2K_050724 [Fragaria x ananassa]
MRFDWQDFQEKLKAIKRKYAELRAASRKKHAAILKQRAEETAAREAAEEKENLRFRAMPFADPSLWFALGGSEVHDHLPRIQLAKCNALLGAWVPRPIHRLVYSHSSYDPSQSSGFRAA